MKNNIKLVNKKDIPLRIKINVVDTLSTSIVKSIQKYL